MPTLVVLRHAKSDYPAGVPDHDRPLASRGLRQAPLAGQWIAEHLPVPDVVLVSTATRTRQTWSAVSEVLPNAPEVHFEPRIYEASVSTLLDILHSVDASADVVLLIGHNPGLEDLVATLASNPESVPAINAEEKFPTSAVAVMRSDMPWSSWSERSAELTHFVVPR